MSWKSLHPCYNGVTDGEARSIIGPVAGTFFPVVDSVDAVIDLKELQGHYIRISVEDADVLYCFMESATDQMDTAMTFDPKVAVPDIIWACTSVREVVPHVQFRYLHIRARNAGESPHVRVRRA